MVIVLIHHLAELLYDAWYEVLVAICLYQLLELLVSVNAFIFAFLLRVYEVRWRRMEERHLVHHRRLMLCLLKRCPLFTHSQLPMQHSKVILAIRQCQLCGYCHIQRTLLVTLWQSLLWL